MSFSELVEESRDTMNTVVSPLRTNTLSTLLDFIKKAYSLLSIFGKVGEDFDSLNEKISKIDMADLEITQDEIEEAIKFDRSDISDILAALKDESNDESIEKILTLQFNQIETLVQNHRKQITLLQDIYNQIETITDATYEAKEINE